MYYIFFKYFFLSHNEIVDDRPFFLLHTTGCNNALTIKSQCLKHMLLSIVMNRTYLNIIFSLLFCRSWWLFIPLIMCCRHIHWNSIFDLIMTVCIWSNYITVDCCEFLALSYEGLVYLIVTLLKFVFLQLKEPFSSTDEISCNLSSLLRLYFQRIFPVCL